MKSYIAKFYTVVKSPQKQALAPVNIVKSSVTLNNRAIQKLIEMRHGDCLQCVFENWTFYVLNVEKGGIIFTSNQVKRVLPFNVRKAK
mgnify:CR=1 FL=1